MSHVTAKPANLLRDVRDFIDRLEKDAPPPQYTLSPEEARAVLENVQSGTAEMHEAWIQDTTLSIGPTGEVDVRVVRPLDAERKLPAIVYYHGGGWVLGSKNTHDRLVRELAARTGAAVIFVDYTPSPEAQYPVQLEQGYAVLEHIGELAEDFRLDAGRIAVAGDSVGGNMAIVAALLAKEWGGPKIRFQLLFYPVTDAGMATESYFQFADGPWLTREAMQWFWSNYLPDANQRRVITASPLQAMAGELAGLPPTLIVTAENDILRDEGEAFASKLDAAGVPVTSLRVNGTIHDFVMLDALADTLPTRAAMAVAVSMLQSALSLRSITRHEKWSMDAVTEGCR